MVRGSVRTTAGGGSFVELAGAALDCTGGAVGAVGQGVETGPHARMVEARAARDVRHPTQFDSIMRRDDTTLLRGEYSGKNSVGPPLPDKVRKVCKPGDRFTSDKPGCLSTRVVLPGEPLM